MRIHLSSGHVYPGSLNGVASHAVHDNLARGLAELGHDVRYRLKGWGRARPPEGVRPASDVEGDEDILHINHLTLREAPATALPWVRIVHCDVQYQDRPPSYVTPNCIFVSRTLAGLYGSDRYVHNGIDPADFIYSETKEDYLLFAVAGGVKKARMKGLDIALRVAGLTEAGLRVAGGSNEPAEMEEFDRYCRNRGAVFLGLGHGRRTAQVFPVLRPL